MGKAYNHLKMGMSTKAFMKMEIHTDMGSIFGKTDQFIREILFKGFGTEKETGPVLMEITTKANLKMIRRMVLGYLIGRMVINTRVSLSMTQDKEKGRCSGKMEAHTKAIGKRVFLMVSVSNLLRRHF